MTNEQILIGVWLRGEHLEDIPLIEKKNIHEKRIVSLLSEGKTVAEIMSRLNRYDIITWTSTEQAPEFLYRSALDVTLRQQLYQAISETEDVGRIQKCIDRYNSSRQETIDAASDFAQLIYDTLEAKRTAETVKYKGLPTLNNMTQGIKRKELTVLAARPSVGKSALALQIAHGVAEDGRKVCFFPLEMSKEQTLLRLICQTRQAESKEVQSGKITDLTRFGKGADMAAALEPNLRIYEGVGNIETIERIVVKEQPYLVVIDQLSLLRSPTPFAGLREQFSYMTGKLKQMAMQYNIAVLLLCQINRGAEGTRPNMANLKESGSIEEDSDNVILLHRVRQKDAGKENEDIFDWNYERMIIIDLAKQRDGETGAFIGAFRPEHFEFYEKEVKII